MKIPQAVPAMPSRNITIPEFRQDTEGVTFFIFVSPHVTYENVYLFEIPHVNSVPETEVMPRAVLMS